jgi:hypothetical protein
MDKDYDQGFGIPQEVFITFARHLLNEQIEIDAKICDEYMLKQEGEARRLASDPSCWDRASGAEDCAEKIRSQK